MTTLDELEWFVVLAETEHMTRAAERLSVTQPTLSRALHRCLAVPTHRAEPGVRYVALADEAAHRRIGLARVRGRETPPVVERFAAFVVDRFADPVRPAR